MSLFSTLTGQADTWQTLTEIATLHELTHQFSKVFQVVPECLANLSDNFSTFRCRCLLKWPKRVIQLIYNQDRWSIPPFPQDSIKRVFESWICCGFLIQLCIPSCIMSVPLLYIVSSIQKFSIWLNAEKL